MNEVGDRRKDQEDTSRALPSGSSPLPKRGRALLRSRRARGLLTGCAAIVVLAVIIGTNAPSALMSSSQLEPRSPVHAGGATDAHSRLACLPCPGGCGSCGTVCTSTLTFSDLEISVASGSKSATISWLDSDAAATNTIQWGLTGAYGNSFSGNTTDTITLVRLSTSTVYDYKITASCSSGGTTGSGSTTGQLWTGPNDGSNGGGCSGADTVVDSGLTWSTSALSATDNFWVLAALNTGNIYLYYGSGSAVGSNTIKSVQITGGTQGIGGDDYSYTFSGLSLGSTYWYEIEAGANCFTTGVASATFEWQGHFSGFVWNTGATATPIYGAVVSINGGSPQVVSSTGAYAWTTGANPSGQSFDIEAQAPGYAPATYSWSLTALSASYDFALSPSPTEDSGASSIYYSLDSYLTDPGGGGSCSSTSPIAISQVNESSSVSGASLTIQQYPSAPYTSSAYADAVPGTSGCLFQLHFDDNANQVGETSYVNYKIASPSFDGEQGFPLSGQLELSYYVYMDDAPEDPGHVAVTVHFTDGTQLATITDSEGQYLRDGNGVRIAPWTQNVSQGLEDINNLFGLGADLTYGYTVQTSWVPVTVNLGEVRDKTISWIGIGYDTGGQCAECWIPSADYQGPSFYADFAGITIAQESGVPTSISDGSFVNGYDGWIVGGNAAPSTVLTGSGVDSSYGTVAGQVGGALSSGECDLCAVATSSLEEAFQVPSEEPASPQASVWLTFVAKATGAANPTSNDWYNVYLEDRTTLQTLEVVPTSDASFGWTKESISLGQYQGHVMWLFIVVSQDEASFNSRITTLWLEAVNLVTDSPSASVPTTWFAECPSSGMLSGLGYGGSTCSGGTPSSVLGLLNLPSGVYNSGGTGAGSTFQAPLSESGAAVDNITEACNWASWSPLPAWGDSGIQGCSAAGWATLSLGVSPVTWAPVSAKDTLITMVSIEGFTNGGTWNDGLGSYTYGYNQPAGYNPDYFETVSMTASISPLSGSSGGSMGGNPVTSEGLLFGGTPYTVTPSQFAIGGFYGALGIALGIASIALDITCLIPGVDLVAIPIEAVAALGAALGIAGLGFTWSQTNLSQIFASEQADLPGASNVNTSCSPSSTSCTFDWASTAIPEDFAMPYDCSNGSPGCFDETTVAFGQNVVGATSSLDLTLGSTSSSSAYELTITASAQVSSMQFTYFNGEAAGAPVTVNTLSTSYTLLIDV